MTTIPRADPPRQAPGVEGEGMDPYPTYRDGPTTPHVRTATRPTDVDLPIARRSYALPILIGLGVFALVIVARLVWGGFNLAATTDGAMTPGDAASPPAATAPAEPAAPAGTAVPETEGSPDEDVQIDGTTGPAEIGDEPGAVDVPGGGTTAPGNTDAPQQ